MSAIVDLFGGGGDDDMPAVQAEQAKRTAEPVEQISEQAKRGKRRAASMVTRDWGKPKLGYAGMLGM